MKVFVGCRIQECQGPTIASLKHHWVIQCPQIAKALNEDRNNFQKSFYLSQNQEQLLKEQRQSVFLTPQLCCCWVSEATCDYQKCKSFSAKHCEKLLCWEACGYQPKVFQGTVENAPHYLVEDRSRPSPNGVREDFSWQISPVQMCACCTLSTKDCLALPAWGWDQCQEWFSQDLLFISSNLINYLCPSNPAGCVSLAVKEK